MYSVRRGGVRARCVDRHRKGRHVAYRFVGGHDLVGAFLLDFVDADNGMHGHKSRLHAPELRFQLFLGRVDEQGGVLPKDDVGDLDEAE